MGEAFAKVKLYVSFASAVPDPSAPVDRLNIRFGGGGGLDGEAKRAQFGWQIHPAAGCVGMISA